MKQERKLSQDRIPALAKALSEHFGGTMFELMPLDVAFFTRGIGFEPFFKGAAFYPFHNNAGA